MIREDARQVPSTVFEGMTSIRAVIDRLRTGDPDARRIERILYDEAHIAKHEKEYRFLTRMGELFSFAVLPTPRETIDQASLGNTHGGVIAYCTERTYPSLSADAIMQGGFYAMIEGIEDPYNFGYALRSLYAAGVDGIVLSPRNWLTAAGVVCRSSAGASERLDIRIADENVCALFRERGYRIVCADMDHAVSAFDADLKKPIFLIVGGEKRGISRKLLDEADLTVKIDYGRPFDEALSAASAATVLAFEVARQNR